MNVGMPVAEVPSTPAVALPHEVVLPTEVTTPERLALVVTVAALPVIESAAVEVEVITPPTKRELEMYPAPWTLNRAAGLVVPMPTLPPLKIVIRGKSLVPNCIGVAPVFHNTVAY